MSPSEHPLRPSLLDDGHKLAAVAGAVLLVSLFLPWYEKSLVPAGSKEFVSQSLSAFGAFTWVEAALLLVDASVLLLLWLRSTDRRVELPAGDGAMIALAGGWMVVLLLVRVFDRPSVTGNGASVGLQWGLLIAMAAAGAMLASGLAIRAIEHATAAPRDPAPPTDEPAHEVPVRWRRPRA
jgi:hypothetical protein